MLLTEGIVLRTLKYGETSLILDIYSRDKGLISCIAGGVRKSKTRLHAATFQLLQLLRVNLYYKEGDRLSRIKDAQPVLVLNDLLDHPIKRVIVIFMAELLQKSIREKELNEGLYNFLQKSILELNELRDHIADFHLTFMIELTSFLGFRPVSNFADQRPFFDLQDGQFVAISHPRNTLTNDESLLLGEVLDKLEGERQELSLNGKKRRILLSGLIRYYQYHVEGFGNMKSPEVIHVVLS
ncbi:MAG: DNA repair protein RecO [Saprospiraceae bacterium]|nr:DNA repair protein RecO [Saprospiraceae bacterium]